MSRQCPICGAHPLPDWGTPVPGLDGEPDQESQADVADDEYTWQDLSEEAVAQEMRLAEAWRERQQGGETPDAQHGQ
jgi:hypothetical protein